MSKQALHRVATATQHCCVSEKMETDTRELNSVSSVISRGLQVPLDEAKNKDVLLRNPVRLRVGPGVAPTHQYPLSRQALRPERLRHGRQAHQILELHGIRAFSPSSRQGGGGNHRGPDVLRILYHTTHHVSRIRFSTWYFCVTHGKERRMTIIASSVSATLLQIHMERFLRSFQTDCFSSTCRTKWSVTTILAHIHCAAGPVKNWQRAR